MAPTGEEKALRRSLMLAALCLAATCVGSPALALDIPMKKALAEHVLDSKTCFASLYRDRQLVGYEMRALYVSRNGRLATLDAVGQSDIGDGKPRVYAGDGIQVEIRAVTSKKTGDDEIHAIREKAWAVIVEDGKRRRLQVDVDFRCSP